MARRSILEDVIEVTSRLPWWLAAAIDAGLFYVIKYILPTHFGETFGAASEQTFSVVAYIALGDCLLGALTGIARRLRDYWIYHRQESIETIRAMSWWDFERMVTEAYRQQGYHAERSKGGPDGVVDISLERSHQTTLVQCKQWKNARVGVKGIRELAGVVAAEKADGGIFVCSGSYTAEAQAFAGQSGIELIDGKGLVRLMAVADNESNSDSQPATASVESCPRCGSELVRRVAQRGKDAGSEFLGCSTFQKCRFTRKRLNFTA